MAKPTVLLTALDALTQRLTAQNLDLYDYGVSTAPDCDAALAQIVAKGRIGALVIDLDLAQGALDGLALAKEARALNPRLHVVYVSRRPQGVPESRKVSKAPTLRSPFFPHQLTGVLSELRSERMERAMTAEAA